MPRAGGADHVDSLTNGGLYIMGVLLTSALVLGCSSRCHCPRYQSRFHCYYTHPDCRIEGPAPRPPPVPDTFALHPAAEGIDKTNQSYARLQTSHYMQIVTYRLPNVVRYYTS